ERNDLRVLLEHGVRVELLVRLHRLDVDVDAVAEPENRALVGRLIVLGLELEADLEVRLRVAAVRMQVNRIGDDVRAGLQQARRLRIEEVRIAPYFVYGPVHALL